MFAYERSVARPALEKLWGRVRTGQPPTPDPAWAFQGGCGAGFRISRGSPTRPPRRGEAQVAVGVAVIVLLPIVVWLVRRSARAFSFVWGISEGGLQALDRRKGTP
jgi:hypothetical protein